MKRLGSFVSGVLAITVGLSVACSSEDDNEVSSNGGGANAPATGGSSGATTSGGTAGAADTGGTGGGTGGSTTSGGSGGSYAACPTLVGLEECGVDSQRAEHLEVNVLLIMDKSGSMGVTPEGYTTTTWEAMRTALSTALTEVASVLNLGLEFFPTSATNIAIPTNCGDSGRCCEMPEGSDMNVNIGPGYNTVPTILSEINSARPAGGTPTRVALQRAYEYFTTGAGAALDGRRIVLLATDGGPNCNDTVSCTLATCTLNIDAAEGCPPAGISCCGTGGNAACLDHQGTIAAIEDLAGIDIPTIVVGVPGAEEYYTYL